jgi:hypothetical protein
VIALFLDEIIVVVNIYHSLTEKGDATRHLGTQYTVFQLRFVMFTDPQTWPTPFVNLRWQQRDDAGIGGKNRNAMPNRMRVTAVPWKRKT